MINGKEVRGQVIRKYSQMLGMLREPMIKLDSDDRPAGFELHNIEDNP